MSSYASPHFRRRFINAIHFRIFDCDFEERHKILNFSNSQSGDIQRRHASGPVMQNKDLLEETFELLDTADVIYVQSSEAKKRLESLLFDITGKYNLISFETA